MTIDCRWQRVADDGDRDSRAGAPFSGPPVLRIRHPLRTSALAECCGTVGRAGTSGRSARPSTQPGCCA